MTIKDFLFSKKYNSLYWRLNSFYINYCPLSKTWNEYNNPYYYWWKARKYFKHPRIHFVYGRYDGYFGLPCRTDAYKIPKFYLNGLGWKDKYHSPRHEWDPIFAFIWTSPFKTTVPKNDNLKIQEFSFHKQYWIGFTWNWIDKKDKNSSTRSMATWEAILDYLYYQDNYKYGISQIVNSHNWGGKDENITIYRNLTKDGQFSYNLYLTTKAIAKNEGVEFV